MSDSARSADGIEGGEKSYLEPVNGIAEAISWPEAGEEVTLRTGESATVERVDRRRHHPVILNDHPFRNVQKRTIAEYSRRVETGTECTENISE